MNDRLMSEPVLLDEKGSIELFQIVKLNLVVMCSPLPDPHECLRQVPSHEQCNL